MTPRFWWLFLEVGPHGKYLDFCCLLLYMIPYQRKTASFLDFFSLDKTSFLYIKYFLLLSKFHFHFLTETFLGTSGRNSQKRRAFQQRMREAVVTAEGHIVKGELWPKQLIPCFYLFHIRINPKFQKRSRIYKQRLYKIPN